MREGSSGISRYIKKLTDGGRKTLKNWENKSCFARSGQISEIADRFERYSKALPSARIVNDVNAISKNPSEKMKYKCISRLPLDAAALNKELGLPQGTITPGMLEDKNTGFWAAVYRSETDGKLILVARDTNPRSLVDWKTNTDNGAGRETDQYASMRSLSSLLSKNGVKFDIAGYSKGGGLAQEAGLVSLDSNVYVFNSSGIPEILKTRRSGVPTSGQFVVRGAENIPSLSRRTSAFAAEGDFLTLMNNSSGLKELENARYLRNQLAFDNWGPSPLKIEHRNPANPEAKIDPLNEGQRTEYLTDLDALISRKEVDPSLKIFPSVRSNRGVEIIPNSAPDGLKSRNKLSLPNLIQHLPYFF